METQQQQPVDKRTATQKISDLEGAFLSLMQTADSMARDLQIAKEAIKLLGNKVDAIVKASSSGQSLNDDVISQIMIDNNVEELKQKVTDLVARGVLKAQEKATDNSFVVGREENDKGEIVNPRLQFALGNLPQPSLREKIKAANIGDVINLEEGKLKFVLLETYEIESPKAEAAPAAAAEEKATETATAQESSEAAAQATDTDASKAAN